MKYRYRTHEEMKDSGVEWIGEIPREWQTTKLKMITKNIGRGKSPEYVENSNVKVINQACIYWDGLKLNNVKFQDEKLNYIRAKLLKGDLLINSTGTGTLGRCNIFNEDGNYICDSHVTVMRFNKFINSKYINYCISTKLYQELIYSTMVTGSTNQIELSREGLRNMDVLICHNNELKRIINFLDKKTSQFDLIISKKEALIEKLEEAKKSLISEVVTGKVKVVKTEEGYDVVPRSSEEMKVSGVEWLGLVPKEWEVKRLKYLFEIKKDIAGKLGYDVLSVTQSGIKIKDITKNEGQLSMDYSKYQLVNKNDFVMNHMDLLTGFVDCSKFNGVTSPDYRVFKLLNSHNCRLYYNYIFQSCYYNKIFYGLAQGVSGMGRWRLQTDKFLNFNLPLPTIEEQFIIAELLDNKIKNINLLKDRLKLNIEKLKEAKQSLITEAVTGKIEILD